jgi:cysteine desulfurase
MFGRKRIYMDWAAATPLNPRVAAVMHEALGLFGNPSAPHEEGRAAYDAITLARKQVATSLSVKPDELTFTSGGTEANNLAIGGLVEALRARGMNYGDMHIVTTSIEHSSVGETVLALEREGVSVTRIEPPEHGIVPPESVIEAVKENTVLVTLAHVNSEIGVIQPIAQIATDMIYHNNAFFAVVPECSFPVIHADCAQSPLYLDASPHTLRALLVSYDAQKIGGPKGVGVLYHDQSVPLAPVLYGGKQERGLRPGTENVPGIVGAGLAFELAQRERNGRQKRVRKMRNLLIEKIETEVPGAVLVGDRTRRIANNACFAIPGADGDYLAVLMDKEGIAVTPRSACIGPGGSVSEVVLALTHDKSLARGTIRFSLGPDTREVDVQRAVTALKKSISAGSF